MALKGISTMATSFDKDAVRRTIYKQWFGDKRYIDLLSVSSKSLPLTFAERLVMSFATWVNRMKPGEAKPLSVIADRLHLGKRQVARAVQSLEEKGLVTTVKGKANATLLLPTGESRDQYFVVKAGRPSSSRLYLLNGNAAITTRDAALLMALYSIAAARGTTFLQNRKRGLAKLASISRSQVDVSLERLKMAGGLVVGADHLALKQPSKEFLANFQDRGCNCKPSGERGRLFSVAANFPGNNEVAQWINDNIAEWQERQIAAGWSLAECKDYWKTTLFGNDPDPSVWKDFILFRLPVLWITAQEQHAETGRTKTCRHLLTSLSNQTIEDLIRERSTL